MNVTERKDLGPAQDGVIDASTGEMVPTEPYAVGATSKMDKEGELDPMEKRGWVTIDKNGKTGYVTIDDSFADLMSHHTVEVAANGKPVKVQPYVYVDE